MMFLLFFSLVCCLSTPAQAMTRSQSASSLFSVLAGAFEVGSLLKEKQAAELQKQRRSLALDEGRDKDISKLKRSESVFRGLTTASQILRGMTNHAYTSYNLPVDWATSSFAHIGTNPLRNGKGKRIKARIILAVSRALLGVLMANTSFVRENKIGLDVMRTAGAVMDAVSAYFAAGKSAAMLHLPHLAFSAGLSFVNRPEDMLSRRENNYVRSPQFEGDMNNVRGRVSPFLPFLRERKEWNELSPEERLSFLVNRGLYAGGQFGGMKELQCRQKCAMGPREGAQETLQRLQGMRS